MAAIKGLEYFLYPLRAVNSCVQTQKEKTRIFHFFLQSRHENSPVPRPDMSTRSLSWFWLSLSEKTHSISILYLVMPRAASPEQRWAEASGRLRRTCFKPGPEQIPEQQTEVQCESEWSGFVNEPGQLLFRSEKRKRPLTPSGNSGTWGLLTDNSTTDQTRRNQQQLYSVSLLESYFGQCEFVAFFGNDFRSKLLRHMTSEWQNEV